MIEINNKKLCESCFCEIDGEVCSGCGFSSAEYSADPLVLPMGTRLGENIVIGRVMGKGGFGVTYLGYDLRMNRTIAVKEYYPNGIAYRSPAGTEVSLADTRSAEAFDNGAEKFYAEAEMVAQFNGNPNIVSVYDYFRANNTVYLVMEYISGITLKSYVKKHGRITDGQALFIMDKIAAALSITHSAGVLHRDISPDNIMICMDGKVKLIDFGAARQIMAESSSNLTVVMKPGYTPVEQYTKKGKQGAWTDIYSLGVSVYYALTEVIIDDPYARMDDDSELEENKHGINSDLWTILKKCTMINASDRYGSAIDLRKALRAVSAPIKPEPLSLDEDDLKIEETAVVPDIIPENVSEENAFPVTVVSDNDEDKTAAIETFEESTAVPSVKDTAVSVRIPDKKKSSKALIAGGCTAAAVIIGIIGILLAGNKPADEDIFITEDMETTAAEVTENSVTTKKDSSERKDSTTVKPPATDTAATTVPEREEETTVSTAATASETTSAAVTATTTAAATTAAKPQTTTTAPTTTTKVTTTTTTAPEKIEKPLYVKLNDKYPGHWTYTEIHGNSLKYFEGDVKITLDIEVVEKSEWASLVIEGDYGKPLDVQAYNNGKNSDNSYWPFGNVNKFAFVVKKEAFNKTNRKVLMTGQNVWVKGATIEDYDPDSDKINPKAKIIQMDSKYQGAWNDSSYIPKKELESFGGDVRVTLDLDILKKDLLSDDDNKGGTYLVQIVPRTSGGTDVVIKADYICPCYWFDCMYVLFDVDVPDKFTFVISHSEIEKLSDEGLCFAGNNFMVKSAALEKA